MPFGEDGIVIGNTPQNKPGQVAGGAGLIGGIISSVTQPFMQKWQQDFERHEAGQAWERNIEAWNMQNEYNSPAQQMQRLQEAGLNPNLVYGKGSAANQASSVAPFQKPRSVSRQISPISPTDPLDVLGKYHGVRKINEEANAASMTNRAAKSTAYITWMDTYDKLKRLKEQTKDAAAKARISDAMAYTQEQIKGWHQEGFTGNDPVGARRMISKYSGDSAAQEYLLNTLAGAKTVSGMLPSFGLGYLKRSKPSLKK